MWTGRYRFTGSEKNLDGSTLERRLIETEQDTRGRAILLLIWNGTLTADYLSRDAGVSVWDAVLILRQLEKEGLCHWEEFDA
jgi:hypothetical protein